MPVEGQAATPIQMEIDTAGSITRTVAKEAPKGAAALTTLPAPEAAKADPKVSSRFAALSRKERALVQAQQEIVAQKAEIAAQLKKIQDFETEWKNDPTKAAESRGLTYAEWTNRVLNDGKPTPEQQVLSVREELDRFRKEQEKKEADARDAQAKAAKDENESVINEFKASVREFIKKDEDAYELINLHDASELVMATVEQYFAQTKKILGTKEACDLVEAHLEEQVMKSTETKKWKAKASPQPKEEPKSKADTAPQQKTLTNSMTSSAPGFLPAATENERIKRAMAALDRTK